MTLAEISTIATHLGMAPRPSAFNQQANWARNVGQKLRQIMDAAQQSELEAAQLKTEILRAQIRKLGGTPEA